MVLKMLVQFVSVDCVVINLNTSMMLKGYYHKTPSDIRNIVDTVKAGGGGGGGSRGGGSSSSGGGSSSSGKGGSGGGSRAPSGGGNSNSGKGDSRGKGGSGGGGSSSPGKGLPVPDNGGRSFPAHSSYCRNNPLTAVITAITATNGPYFLVLF